MSDDKMSEARLRKMELQQAEILGLLRSLTEKMDDRISQADRWRFRVDSILVGDGNGRIGHNVRLDRLEQAASQSKWFLRVLGGGMVMLALRALQSLLT